MRRSRPVSQIITLSLATLMLVGLSTPGPVHASTPGVYISLGDSIAAGIGASLPRTRGNAALVSRWLERLSGEAVPHENLAVPGETAESFLNGGQLQRFRDIVARSSAAGVPIAAVTVSLGGNELLGLQFSGLSDRQAGLDRFSTQYAEAVAAIRAEIGPDTPLVVSTYYDLSNGDATIQYSDAWWVEQFNDVIRRAAADQNGRLAEIGPRFDGRIEALTHAPFDVHPTNAGHVVIAGAIWEALGVDRESPRIVAPAEIEATRATPTVQFSVDDNVGVQSVTASSDDVALRGPFQVDDGAYAILIHLETADREDIALTIEISDDAGNISQQEVTVRVADISRGENE